MFKEVTILVVIRFLVFRSIVSGCYRIAILLVEVSVAILIPLRARTVELSEGATIRWLRNLRNALTVSLSDLMECIDLPLIMPYFVLHWVLDPSFSLTAVDVLVLLFPIVV